MLDERLAKDIPIVPMDRFTRNYAIILGGILLLTLAWLLYEDPQVSDLNEQLARDSEVAGYPYRFRVLELNNGVATLSTPRTAEFPVHRALAILFPPLAKRAQDDPDLMRAQESLVRVQKRAAAIVLESGEIRSVRWRLDRNWLSRHGVQLGGAIP